MLYEFVGDGGGGSLRPGRGVSRGEAVGAAGEDWTPRFEPRALQHEQGRSVASHRAASWVPGLPSASRVVREVVVTSGARRGARRSGNADRSGRRGVDRGRRWGGALVAVARLGVEVEAGGTCWVWASLWGLQIAKRAAYKPSPYTSVNYATLLLRAGTIWPMA